jgi:hypothetical protein
MDTGSHRVVERKPGPVNGKFEKVRDDDPLLGWKADRAPGGAGLATRITGKKSQFLLGNNKPDLCV